MRGPGTSGIIAAAVLGLAGRAFALSDSEVRQQMIEASVAAVAGKCPCPGYRLNNGRPCGSLSAWSESGGVSPLCYPGDITDDMVAAWRLDRGIDAAAAPVDTAVRVDGVRSSR